MEKLEQAQAYPNPDQEKACQAAKRTLRAKGWSYRAAAPVLGVHFCHLSQVLNGHRVSAPVLEGIKALPYTGEEGIRRAVKALFSSEKGAAK